LCGIFRSASVREQVGCALEFPSFALVSKEIKIMAKATMSFEEKRNKLIQAAKNNGGEQAASKNVIFDDNAILSFLKKFRQYQDDSRKIYIQAK
jgi:hypothetical protein